MSEKPIWATDPRFESWTFRRGYDALFMTKTIAGLEFAITPGRLLIGDDGIIPISLNMALDVATLIDEQFQAMEASPKLARQLAKSNFESPSPKPSTEEG